MYQYLLLLDTDREKEFFQKIYRRYKHEMYHAAYGILKNNSDAEDIVHETFLTLIYNLDKMMDNPPHKNWNYILTIVKHKCYNLCKKNGRETDGVPEDWEQKDVFDKGLEAKMEKAEQREVILELLRKMYKPYRDVLLLQYYHEMSVTEIAEIMEKTPDNIRHISMRAKKKLQTMLEKYGVLE